MIARNEATEAQVRAAQPGTSTWLSANAGSGKTKVLTDRVARLLLQDVLPQHILCLTYTKAAASEMQNRLFKTLGAWAMLQDDLLRANLRELGVEGVIDAERLRKARTLFARAIETPGGLKIQTIHSFCAAILRRFPLEAGVSPLFQEMEDRAAALLRDDILAEMADSADRMLMSEVAAFSALPLADLAAIVASDRAAFQAPAARDKICDTLGVPHDISEASVLEAAFIGDEEALVSELARAAATGSANDIKLAEKLVGWTTGTIGSLLVLEAVFLTGPGAKEPFSAKLGSVPTKKTQADHPGLAERLAPLMQRVEEAAHLRRALAVVDRSVALQAFGGAFLARYAAAKQLRGWLDFDDLILRARDLLDTPEVAQWVLYRLDGGIDHILVDEAQDTSPVQWHVIESLAQEFSSGQGARGDAPRTIFVVGDKKQSIYSFQGADPREFDRMRDEFAARLGAVKAPFQSCGLDFSFRSSQAVLRLVDHCFPDSEAAGFPGGMQHRAFHADMPGRVDLWPVVPKADPVEDGPWYQPLDRLGERHHAVELARRVACEIRRMIDEKITIPAGTTEGGQYLQRPVSAGDVMILVQRRSDLFHEIIRACKEQNLPIAGADRLKVGGELAVRDLAALLSFLAIPEDDLALANALKSPLFGWTEQMLFDLAHRRGEKEYLWQALRDRRPDFPEALAIIDDLLEQTDFLRPYDLIERILTRHGGRARLLGRLGAEAEDGINALLSQALAFERNQVPSLTGFLVWMETDDLEIKRQLDSAGDRIRVMTVHGAKGLESPIVILPDTGQIRTRSGSSIVKVDGLPLWPASASDAPPEVKAARETVSDAQRAERERLLYVALTRAEKWLIVVAAGDLGKDGRSWYDTVQTGMTALGAAPHDLPGGEGLRYEHGDWSGGVMSSASAKIEDAPELPDYLDAVAPAPTVRAAPLSPSDLGGAKALPGDAGLDEDAAKARGTWMHLLLEHLPDTDRDRWPVVADRLLRLADPAPPKDTIPDLLDEVTCVLESDDATLIFAPDGFAEVSIAAEVDGRALSGQIDRLLVSDDAVLAVDFKTNATVPHDRTQTPEGLLRQMGAYAAMLAQIYPDRRIDTAILWTRTGALMPLPHDLVTDAFARAGSG